MDWTPTIRNRAELARALAILSDALAERRSEGAAV